MKLLSIVIGIMLIVEFASTENFLVGVKWNKRSKKFDPIPGLHTYEAERRKIILTSRQRELHNFNLAPVNLTYYEDLGFFQYYDNDTKVTGIVGDLWTTLSKYLNFTLILSKSDVPSLGQTHKDGTYDGIMEYARLNQTDVVPKMAVYVTRLGAVDFGPVLWMNCQRIFAYGQWKPNRAWMFNLFSTEIWIFIIAFIATLSLASVVTQRILTRHRGRKFKRSTYFDHLFYTFATSCNQAGTCDNIGRGSKILNLTIAIFSFLVLVVYNSRLIISMSEESFDAPFNDLEGLLENTNFRIVVLDSSVSHLTFNSEFAMPIFKRIRESNRVTVVTNVEELYEKVCKYSNKYVMLDAEDAVAARGKTECSVIPVGIPYYMTPIAAGISKRMKNKKSLDLGIMKLRENGVLDAIKKRYMKINTIKRAIRQSDRLVIDVDRVAIIFGILCLGIVISIIICAIENIVFTLTKHKTVQNFAQKISAIRRSMFVNSLLRCRGRNR